MCNSSRSKIVTLAPVLSIINELEETIYIQEHTDKYETQWKSVEPISISKKVNYFWKNK